MKTISPLHIIAAAITSLFILAIIKVNFGGDEEIAYDGIDYQSETASFETGSYAAQSPQIQNNIQIEGFENPDISSDLICEASCQDEIFNALRYGGLLTEDIIARIRSDPAGYAKQLMSKPKILSHLFLTLKADEGDDNGTQIAALAVLQAFSDEEKMTLGQALSAETDSQDRIVGLELLEASLGTQAGSLQTLNQRLVDESHPSALSKAIHIASNLPTTAQIDGTVQALTEIIRYNTSDHFSGAALLAKVNLAPRSTDVYEDISASLTSFSGDKNEVGLTALQNALQRYETEFGAEGGWYDDFSLREKVRAIAQNNEVSEATRTEASNLLNSYFSDDD